jgi:hypothetical protein
VSLRRVPTYFRSFNCLCARTKVVSICVRFQVRGQTKRSLPIYGLRCPIQYRGVVILSLFTRVEIGQIVIGSDGYVISKSWGSGSSPSQRS